MKGAEAVVRKCKLIGLKCVEKNRFPKDYRNSELDKKLRAERTKQEARLLNRAKKLGIKCPTVLEVGEYNIIMTFVDGKRANLNNGKFAEGTGKILAKLHSGEIIHGDYTPANLISNGRDLFLIDFGLGHLSNDIEDKAIDVLTMLKSLNEKTGEKFLGGYSEYSEFKKIIARVKQIKERARYA